MKSKGLLPFPTMDGVVVAPLEYGSSSQFVRTCPRGDGVGFEGLKRQIRNSWAAWVTSSSENLARRRAGVEEIYNNRVEWGLGREGAAKDATEIVWDWRILKGVSSCVGELCFWTGKNVNEPTVAASGHQASGYARTIFSRAPTCVLEITSSLLAGKDGVNVREPVLRTPNGIVHNTVLARNWPLEAQTTTPSASLKMDSTTSLSRISVPL